MPLKAEQALKLQQKLILSPQMQQAINLLQLPLTELRLTAAQELMKNPLLEEVPDQEIEIGTAEEADSDSADKIQETPAKEVEPREEEEILGEEAAVLKEAGDKESETIISDFQDEFKKLTEMDDEWRDYFRMTAPYYRYTEEEEAKRQYLENSITSAETLEDHLKDQLHLSAENERQIEIGENIIGNLDDNGFLQVGLEEIAQATAAPLEEVEKALQLIHTFHPVGAGSRNLQECLLVQLERLGRKDSLAAKIVRGHLEELAMKKYPQIAKSIGTTVEAVKQAHEEIGQLDPKPGRMFSRNDNFYPIPDVVIQKNEDDQFEIVLNNEKIPHLRISQLYRQLMAEGGDLPTREYVRGKVKAGLWFIKNIQQRQKTIYNIALELLRVQREFFENNTNFLKPLTMQEAAQAIGVHESTVSRATTNKYIQTPQGLFQMKYFFSSGVKTTGGGSTSTTSVKERILELFRNEDKKKPLADHEIISILKREGIEMARRTIAKYRKELKILPTHLRREH